MRSVVATGCGVLCAVFLVSASPAYGISSFPDKIPNVANVPGISGTDCNVCHAPGAQNVGNLNSFGLQFEAINGGTAGVADAGRAGWIWSSAVAAANADGDGFTNGQELQDPDGTYPAGGAAPGNAALVRSPSDASSIPPIIAADPTELNVTAQQFSSPANASFTVTNTGGTGGFNPQVSDDQTWLSETLTGGNGTVTFATTGLAIGTYTAEIQVSQTGVFNTDTIEVNLEIVTACGNGTVNSGEQCDPGADVATDCCTASCQFVAAATQCRASTDAQCDPAEVCSGSSGACPANAFTPNGTTCTNCGASHCSGGACTSDASVCGDSVLQCGEACDGGGAADNCCNDGAGGNCTFESAETVCRAASGDCDVADHCTGTSLGCTADAVRANGSVCRPLAAGGCDVAETCNGVAKTCPADGFRPAGDVCRPEDTSNCDVAESCTGSSVACPVDGFEPEGTYCSQEEICSIDGVCADPVPDPQSKEQVRCLQKWNAASASAANAFTKQVSTCVTKAVKFKLRGELDACVESPSGKTSAAIGKADDAARAKCANEGTPDFGTNDEASLDELTAEAVVGAYHDLFGPDLEGVVPAITGSTAKCQDALSKSFAKCLAGKFSSFSLCSKKGLKGKSASIVDFVDLQSCLEFESNGTHVSCALDDRSKLRKRFDKKCPSDSAALGTAFPGCLADQGDGVLDRDELYACYERTAACRSCQALTTWGNLARDCDLLDDGDSTNDSCE